MKKIVLFAVSVLTALSSTAQSATPVTEEKPYTADGIEYGYSILNESKRDVGGKDFNRYQVSVYATNKSECSRVILFSQSLGKDESDMNVLAKFDCINATGAKLTSKSGSVTAKPMGVMAKVAIKDAAGKSVIENQKVQIGYYLGAGETVSNNVIFIVPLNDKPNIRVRIINRASVL